MTRSGILSLKPDTHRDENTAVTFSIWKLLSFKIKHAPIAQRIEHRSSEPGVVGSNPSRRASKLNKEGAINGYGQVERSI
jgi:hypothetical protein